MNLVCAICSDLFVPSDDVHITPCGHMFHHTCLIQWLERSKTCPQCRNRCAETRLVKVYFNVAASLDNTEDSASLLQKLDDMTLKIREQDKLLKSYEEKVSSHKIDQKKMRKVLLGLEEQLQSKESAILIFKHENDMLKGDRKIKQKLETELGSLKEELESYATIKQAMNSTVQEVEQMLASDTSRGTVVALATLLKRELQAQETKKKEQSARLHRLQNEFNDEKKRRKTLEEMLSSCESEIYRLEQLLKQSKAENAANTCASCGNGSSNEESIPSTPNQPQIRRKRPLVDLNESTPMSEKVRKIIDSTSPYLPVKMSSIGLAPLMRAGISQLAQSSTSKDSISSSTAHGSSQFSIFKNQRPASTISTSLRSKPTTFTKASNKNEADKGPAENTCVTSEAKGAEPRFKITSATVVARLKTGKLTRHPSTVLPRSSAIDLDSSVEMTDFE